MNWISSLSQVFFAVLVTSVTGTVMFLIWFLCRIFLQKRNPKLVYYMLRWVVMMYLLPITYVSLVMNYKAGYVEPMDSMWKLLFVVNIQNVRVQGVAVIWLVWCIVLLGITLKKELVRYKICKNNFEDGASLAQTEFERIKEVVGVKEKVELYRNDDVRLQSPFVTGFFRRRVVVPYLEYSKEELQVILYHELNHIRKSDMIFRYLTMLAIIINCINPIAYLLWGQMLLWSEADCDAYAVDGLEREGISKKQYYKIILRLMEDPKMVTLFYAPMLFRAKNSLYRRIDVMENYRTNMRRVAKSVTFAWVMIFALVSSVTAYAAGEEIVEAGDKALLETQQVERQGGFEESTGWSEEIFVPAGDVPEMVYFNDDIMLLGAGTFDWNVRAGVRGVGNSIYLTAGTEVQIACTATPSNCLYWFGLMNANTDCYIVEGTGSGSHTFTIPSNGYYRIMVENRSTQQIRVMGTYQY